jgi:predicted secreted protein
MKLRIFLIFTIFTTVLLLSSCIVTSHDFNVEISCDEFGESNHRSGEFEVEVGDKIRVELCSNPTTGFQWDYETTIENVLKEEDHDFEEPKGDVPGAAGIEVWTFEAVEKGTTEVQMEYSQPWQGGLKAEWTYTVIVTVE